jgi:hypothetical protein
VPFVAFGKPLCEPLAREELLSFAAVDRMVLKRSMAEIAEARLREMPAICAMRAERV